MSNMVPGRPRRQQQAYRRANTSLTLMSNNNPGPQDSDPDPYISCTNILDKFKDTSGAGSGATGAGSGAYGAVNGTSPARKSSAGGIKDFLLGRSSHSRKDSSSHKDNSDLVPQWSVQESVIDELRISTIPRQPKYSYLIGKSSQKDKDDYWRKSNAVSSVNNNVYNSPGSTSSYNNNSTLDSYYGHLPMQHNSSSSKRLNDYQQNHNAAQSAAYEDRISTALRKNPSSSNIYSNGAVQKSKSYSNFDFVRRDLNFQVCSDYSLFTLLNFFTLSVSFFIRAVPFLKTTQLENFNNMTFCIRKHFARVDN